MRSAAFLSLLLILPVFSDAQTLQQNYARDKYQRTQQVAGNNVDTPAHKMPVIKPDTTQSQKMPVIKPDTTQSQKMPVAKPPSNIRPMRPHVDRKFCSFALPRLKPWVLDV